MQQTPNTKNAILPMEIFNLLYCLKYNLTYFKLMPGFLPRLFQGQAQYKHYVHGVDIYR